MSCNCFRPDRNCEKCIQERQGYINNQVNKAINDVYIELKNMGKDKFNKLIDSHKSGDIAEIVMEIRL